MTEVEEAADRDHPDEKCTENDTEEGVRISVRHGTIASLSPVENSQSRNSLPKAARFRCAIGLERRLSVDGAGKPQNSGCTEELLCRQSISREPAGSEMVRPPHSPPGCSARWHQADVSATARRGEIRRGVVPSMCEFDE